MLSKAKASRTAAALTGAWTAAGMKMLGAWHKNTELDTLIYDTTFVVVAVVFFIPPVLIFVFGLPIQVYKLGDVFSSEYWDDMGTVFVRMLCWLLGGGVIMLFADSMP